MSDMPSWNNRRILITGAQGFIGRHLTKAIAVLNPKELILVGQSVQKYPEDAPIAQYVQLDLRNRSAVEDFARDREFDTIFNLAGKIDQSIRPNIYQEQMEINYLGTLNLVESFLGKVKHFIQMGSNAEYGNATTPHGPQTVELPNSAYGVSKLAATKMILAKRQSENFPGTVVRPFLVFGTGQNERSFLGLIVTSIKESKVFETTSCTQTRDFTPVEFVVESLINVDSSDVLLNICSGVEIQLIDVLNTVSVNFTNFKYELGKISERKTELKQSLGLYHNKIKYTKAEVLNLIATYITDSLKSSGF